MVSYNKGLLARGAGVPFIMNDTCANYYSHMAQNKDPYPCDITVYAA